MPPQPACRRAAAALGTCLVLLVACSNEPRPPCEPPRATASLGTLCGFENPEDVAVLPEAGLLLVSEIRVPGAAGGGAIAAVALGAPEKTVAPRRLWPIEPAAPRDPVRGSPDCRIPPDPSVFSPHGIHAARRPGALGVDVAVVNHGGRESIELFVLEGAGSDARLEWQGCVGLPEGAAANDLWFGPGGTSEIVASNYMPEMRGPAVVLHQLRGALGIPTGDVLVWNPDRGWRAVVGTSAPPPNGVLVSPDGRWIFYAQTGVGRVARVAFEGSPPREIEIEGHPDNLSWSSRGEILVATHLDGPGFLACAVGRRPCRTGWAVYAIDPETLAAREILRHGGERLGAVASVADHDGTFYIGSVFDDRIGVWRRPGP